MSSLRRSATLLALVALAGCASETKSSMASPGSSAAAKPARTHAEISQDVTATAKVVGVDAATRMVSLMNEMGEGFAVHCGDEVRNFEQIAAGDTLKVHFKRTLGASLLPPGSDPNLASGGLVAGRAAMGEKPAGGVGAMASIRVKITSVDLTHDIVVFTAPTGELFAHQLMTSDGREFAKGLKVGDLVQLDYAEALALSVEKM